MSETTFIGFPPGLLRDKPCRFPVLIDSAELVAVDKSAGPAVRAHPWNQSTAHMDAALNQQLADGKPELLKLRPEIFASIYYFEPEASGVSVFAKTRESFEVLRNAYGSGHFSFRFLFVSEDVESDTDLITSDAPLLAHRTKEKMIPSTAKGKKALTRFRRLAKSPISEWVLWEASLNFLRMHQVRVHAALKGIPLMGDPTYGGVPVPTKADLVSTKKRGGGSLRRPLFNGMPLHLAAVSLPGSGEVVEACLPRDFQLLLRRLEIPSPQSV